MSTLKELVAGGKLVHFQFYRKGELHYKTDDGFSFVVPAEDAGDASFLASDRAMLFMRYIRKQLEANAEGLAGETNDQLQNQVPHEH